MAVFLVKRSNVLGRMLIDGIQCAVVEAANATAARTAAAALDARLPSDYFASDVASATDIEGTAYLGGLFTEPVVENGV